MATATQGLCSDMSLQCLRTVVRTPAYHLMSLTQQLKPAPARRLSSQTANIESCRGRTAQDK